MRYNAWYVIFVRRLQCVYCVIFGVCNMQVMSYWASTSCAVGEHTVTLIAGGHVQWHHCDTATLQQQTVALQRANGWRSCLEAMLQHYSNATNDRSGAFSAATMNYSGASHYITAPHYVLGEEHVRQQHCNTVPLHYCNTKKHYSLHISYE